MATDVSDSVLLTQLLVSVYSVSSKIFSWYIQMYIGMNVERGSMTISGCL